MGNTLAHAVPLAQPGVPIRDVAPYDGTMAESEEQGSSHGGRRPSGWGASIAEVGAAIQGGVAPVASRMEAAVSRGVHSVGRALEDPAAAALAAEVLKQSDLPEVEAQAPLASLAVRLDREADLWRGLALRQLARASWMERIAISSLVIAFGMVVALSVIAAFRALFASGSLTGSGSMVALLLGVGVGLLTIGSGVIHAVTARVRRGQIEVARESLLRADLSKLRLQRVAVLLELRSHDAQAFRSALQKLESEIR